MNHSKTYLFLILVGAICWEFSIGRETVATDQKADLFKRNFSSMQAEIIPHPSETRILSPTKTQSSLKKYIKKQWKKALQSIDSETLEDIYAFSFWVLNEDDDPRVPVLIIGYNTHLHFQSQIPLASDEREAKWNFAFWLQNDIAIIGGREDAAGKKKIDKWISALGLNYTDEEEGADFDKCLLKGTEITQQFNLLLIECVQEILAEGSTSLPILIHELEYYDEISKRNIEANGAERVKEFTDWIDELQE